MDWLVGVFDYIGDIVFGGVKGLFAAADRNSDIVSVVIGAVTILFLSYLFVYLSLKINAIREILRFGKLHVFDPLKRVKIPIDRSFTPIIRTFYCATGTDSRLLFNTGYRNLSSRSIMGGCLVISVFMAAVAALLFINKVLLQSGIDDFHGKVVILAFGVGVYAAFIYMFDLSIAISEENNGGVFFARVVFSVFVSLSISSEISTSMFHERIVEILKNDNAIETMKSKAKTHRDDYVRLTNGQDGKVINSTASVIDVMRKETSVLQNISPKLQAVLSTLSAAIEAEREGRRVPNGLAAAIAIMHEMKLGVETSHWEQVYKSLIVDGVGGASFAAGQTSGKPSRSGGKNNRIEDVISSIHGVLSSVSISNSNRLIFLEKDLERAHEEQKNLSNKYITDASALIENIKSVDDDINEKIKSIERDSLLHHVSLFRDILFGSGWEKIVAWPIFIIILCMDMIVVLAKKFLWKAPIYEAKLLSYEGMLKDWNLQRVGNLIPQDIDEQDYQEADEFDHQALKDSEVQRRMVYETLKNLVKRDK